MSVQTLIAGLELEINDPEEESFLLFSQSIPSQDLGFLDPKALSLDVTIGGRDMTIHQSPTILSSNREGGTTGAVIWRITPIFANWIISSKNILFRSNVLSSKSSVLELGCGISGIIGLALGPLVQEYTLTDQEYVMKFLNQNLINNAFHGDSAPSKSRKSRPRSGTTPTASRTQGKVVARPLDWERDEVSSFTCSGDGKKSFDAIISCDCIYNEALIQPLVQTCIDACQLRKIEPVELAREPAVCIIAQQLRSAEVFEEWLKAFHKFFRVWRIPDADLVIELSSDSGFVVHLGILSDASNTVSYV